MDLLGSILGNMEKPPTASDEQRKNDKANKEKMEKLHEEERKYKAKFRADVEDKVTTFIKDAEKTRHRFSPMNKIQRTIVHEVAEIAGLISQGFGKEDEGRYVMLFKKEFPPAEEELNAYKRGEEWEPGKANKAEPEEEVRAVKQTSNSTRTPKKKNAEPLSNYRDKYRHLIGTSSAKDAARKTEANKAFGMVPSQNKRDIRSIEETMNEIRKKKRQKIENESGKS